jgi:hypothetical protein
MAYANVAPLLIWGGLALIVWDHFGMTAAGATLIIGAAISIIVTVGEGR